MIYPIDPRSALAYAAHLSETRQAPFVAMQRPPPPAGHTFAAVSADEVDDFLESGWQRIPPPTLINLTPKPVTIKGVTVEPSGQVAKVSSILINDPLSGFLPIPLARRVFLDVDGLPPATPLQFLIVTPDVAEAAKRADLVTCGDQALIQSFP